MLANICNVRFMEEWKGDILEPL